VKKSMRPKLPVFSVLGRPSVATGATAWHHGTPGSICAPVRICVTPRACTQAPEASPPATHELAHATLHQAACDGGNAVVDY
jgi:hypothetical protein